MAHRVLLVDDTPDQRLFYEAILREAGYEVITAGGGREGIEIVQKDKSLATILLDMNMPNMDGIETMNRMLAIDHTLSIIFLTANDEKIDNYRTFSADGYVVKSHDPRELLEVVGRIIKEGETKHSHQRDASAPAL